jgi:hypothetical protein
MRRVSRFVLAVGLALVVAAPVAAQQQKKGRGQGQRGQFGGGQGGAAALLENEGVQKELKLEADQVSKAKDVVKSIREKHKDAFDRLRDASQEERRTKSRELGQMVSQETLAALKDVLKPDQLKRLKQIELQAAGVAAFTTPEVQKALNLTDQQREELRTINDAYGKQMRELIGGGNEQGGRERMATLRKETMTKVQAVLTDAQKGTWKELTGEPFEVRFGQRRRPGGDR